MGLIKNLLRGFKGGPDFSNCIEVTAILEDWQLNLTVPNTNIVTEEEPQNINYPFKQAGWFEATSKWSCQHRYVPIDTQLWYYLPMNFLLQTELGVLSLSTQLKRIAPEKNTNAMELHDLGRYVIAEYDEYYNAPLDSPQGPGPNVRRRKSVEDEVRKAWEGYVSEEEIQQKILDRLPELPYPPLPPHEIRSFNHRHWVFCVEPKLRSDTHDNMYCYPLSEEYYLCLRFRHRVDWNPKYKNWKDHANAAEKRVMEMVRLEKVETTTPPEETQPLLE
ncbi:hypothetical protein [Aliikangiella sp. IMCC44359]|uniref:hypothetical protein n=1 Tax=Aliikangiella sp. IMCC44359 TaxID=3459125 RepID=UPI00403ADC93